MNGYPTYYWESARGAEIDFVIQREGSIVRDTFQTLFQNSVFYVLARRCGLEPMNYLKLEDFAGIKDFNTLTVLSYLGENTSRIAEPVLRDIGRKVRRIYQQETQKTLANESLINQGCRLP